MTTPIKIAVDRYDGLAVAEGRINQMVEKIITQITLGETVLPLGQSELLSGIRLAVKQGKIPPVTFVFEGMETTTSPCGRLAYWPPGFPGDVLDLQLHHLIDWTPPDAK